MWTFEFMPSPYRTEWQRFNDKWEDMQIAASMAARYMIAHYDKKMAVRLCRVHIPGE